MDVLILTEGGKNIGFGHITRCIALAEAFEEKGTFAKFLINGTGSIQNLLINKEFERFNWLKTKDKLLKLARNYDFIIIDSYLAEKSLYDEISDITNGRLLMIDDYNRLEYPKGIVVNPSIYGDRVGYSQKDGRIDLLGKDYIILRKEFWDVPEKVINKEVRNILITFGGMKEVGLEEKISALIKEEFGCEYAIINSRDKILTGSEMLDSMIKTDICISGGGQTTYELARVGVPVIGVCFADNQKFNLERSQKEGLIDYVGWYNEKDLFKKIEGAVKKMASYGERFRRSQVGTNCVDGKGSKRIIEKTMIKSKA